MHRFRFAHGVYSNSGIFGGIVIGATVDEFHEAATLVRDNITLERTQQRDSLTWIIAVSLVLVVMIASLISRGITLPVHNLAQAARAMEQGVLHAEILNHVLN